MQLRKVIKREYELFKENSLPLSEEIRQFGAWRNDWQSEKQRWSKWQPVLVEDGDLVELKSTF